MRQLPVLLLCLGSFAVCAQTSAPNFAENIANKRIALAQQEISRISDLVDMGALPRIRLDQARQQLADAQDDATLAQTLYGDLPLNDLTDKLADDMIAAAQRRVDREQARLDQVKKMVDDGLEAQYALHPILEELSMRQTTLDLARSRARLMSDMAGLAKLEQSIAESQDAARTEGADFVTEGMEHFEGNGVFREARDLQPIETAFAKQFARPLPISADGETNLHRALGFDHRGRVDVAVAPNTPEGIWLRGFLKARQIPYYAFTHALPGRATGAHIHIGPGSTRLNAAD
jgi:hypothetical protein